MKREKLKQILNIVTCNGMRELTEERALQAMKEATNESVEILKTIASDYWNGLPLTDEKVNSIEQLLKEATEL